MKLSLITAASENDVIGMQDGSLPWDLPEELAYFREVTKGKPVIMGRTTFESIINKLHRPLPGRHNIVLTRDPQRRETWPSGEDARVDAVGTLEQAVVLAAQDSPEEAFVIGGAQIYEMALRANIVDRIYLTRVHMTVPFTQPEEVVFFPVEAMAESAWELEQQDRVATGAVPFTKEVYERLVVGQVA